MIDRTLLTEALADFDNPPNWTEAWEDDHRMGRSLRTLADAARLLLDFPTNEQVEAALAYLLPYLTDHMEGWSEGWQRKVARGVLVAVRDTMIGDNHD